MFQKVSTEHSHEETNCLLNLLAEPDILAVDDEHK